MLLLLDTADFTCHSNVKSYESCDVTKAVALSCRKRNPRTINLQNTCVFLKDGQNHENIVGY